MKFMRFSRARLLSTMIFKCTDKCINTAPLKTRIEHARRAMSLFLRGTYSSTITDVTTHSKIVNLYYSTIRVNFGIFFLPDERYTERAERV